MSTTMILALLGLAGLGYALLRKPPERAAVEAAALAAPEVAELREVTATGRELTAATFESFEQGDLAQAAVSTVALAVHQLKNPMPDRMATWVEGVLATWGTLPDSWISERTFTEAGVAVERYLPSPYAHRSLTPEQFWTSIEAGAEAEHPVYAQRWATNLRNGWWARRGGTRAAVTAIAERIRRLTG